MALFKWHDLSQSAIHEVVDALRDFGLHLGYPLYIRFANGAADLDLISFIDQERFTNPPFSADFCFTH